ncbi:hypothetical protein Pcinc_004701 [Petrolisthes cinctipes]|uniref:Uncharacterized protein n=1 Tax=Petrolisthes cinctipes TaxID=88211 RepID=A0AAE1GEZ4_PETCI|nr:hypothetical protein Pcinc_004701 [Petrolisthes cinctipes]
MAVQEVEVTLNERVWFQVILLLCFVMAVSAHSPPPPQSGEIQTESPLPVSTQSTSAKIPLLLPLQPKTTEPFKDDLNTGQTEPALLPFTPSQPLPHPSQHVLSQHVFTSPESVLPHRQPTSLSHELFQRHIQLASSPPQPVTTPQLSSQPESSPPPPYSRTLPSSLPVPASSQSTPGSSQLTLTSSQPASLLHPTPKEEGSRIVSFNSIVSYYGRFKPTSPDQSAQTREAPHLLHPPSQAILNQPIVSVTASHNPSPVHPTYSQPSPQHVSHQLPPLQSTSSQPVPPQLVFPKLASPQPAFSPPASPWPVSSPVPPSQFLSAPPLPLPHFFNPETFQSARIPTSTLRPEPTQPVLSHHQPEVPHPVSLERSTLIHAPSQPVIVRVVAPKAASPGPGSTTSTSSSKPTTTSESTTPAPATTSPTTTPLPPLDQMTSPSLKLETVSFHPIQQRPEPATSLPPSFFRATPKEELRRPGSFRPSLTYHNLPRLSKPASINAINPSNQQPTSSSSSSRPAPSKKVNSVKVTVKPVTPTTVLLKPVSHQPEGISDLTITSDEFIPIVSFPRKSPVSFRPVLRRPVISQPPTSTTTITTTKLKEPDQQTRLVASSQPDSFKTFLPGSTYFHPISSESSSPKPVSPRQTPQPIAIRHKNVSSKPSVGKKVVREVVFKPSFRPVLLRPTLPQSTSPSSASFHSSFSQSDSSRSTPFHSPLPQPGTFHPSIPKTVSLRAASLPQSTSFTSLPHPASLRSPSPQPVSIRPSSPKSTSHRPISQQPGSSQPAPPGKRAVRTSSYLPKPALLTTKKSEPTSSNQKDARATRTAPFNYPVHPHPANYDFSYQVRGEGGKLYGHQEARQGPVTRGLYYVPLADGRLQKVTYYVEGNSGFVAQVSYEGQARYPPHKPHHARRPTAHSTHHHTSSKHSHESTPHSYNSKPHSYKPSPHSYKSTPHSYKATPHSYKPTPVPRPSESYKPIPSFKPTTPGYSPSYFTPGAGYSTPASAFLSTGLGAGATGYSLSPAYPRTTPGNTYAPDLSFSPTLAPEYKTSPDQ